MIIHKNKKSIYEKCKAAGICTRCKKRPAIQRPERISPLVNCEECAAVLKVGAKERAAARTNRLKAFGRCVQCGKHPAIEGYTRCQTCRKKGTDCARRTQPKRHENRKARGLCKLCGARPHIESMKHLKTPMCEPCFYKVCSQRALGNRQYWEALKTKLISQNFKCAYTGRHLIFGVNASVDHILPVARYPHLKSDPNNIQWVAKNINYMKNNFLSEEFLALVKEIAAYRL
jgi:hypothetical protein